MRLSFFELYKQLDRQRDPAQDSGLIMQYLNYAADSDKCWFIWLFSGNRPKKVLSITSLRAFAIEFSGMSDWLFDACAKETGDLAETIALILPGSMHKIQNELSSLMEQVYRVATANEADRKFLVKEIWQTMDVYERFVFNKLLCGGFRKRIPLHQLCSLLSSYSGVEAWRLTLRLSQKWTPVSHTFTSIVFTETAEECDARPYPQITYVLLSDLKEVKGDTQNWHIQAIGNGWKLQVVKRNGSVFLWDEEQIISNDKFPEMVKVFSGLPDGTVIYGELVAASDEKRSHIPFIQKRGQRIDKVNCLPDQIVQAFYIEDILEYEGAALCNESLHKRLGFIEMMLNLTGIKNVVRAASLSVNSLKEFTLPSATAIFPGVNTLLWRRLYATSEDAARGGFILKLDAPLHTMKAVLIYAETAVNNRGSATLQFTFALWKDEQLVPVTKADSASLNEAEIRLLLDYIKCNTLEKFGPVKSLRPDLLFELTYEKVVTSARHKSGIRLTSPKLLRWLKDEDAKKADKLEVLTSLI